MDNSPNPIGPGFKKTDLKAGMRIKFPYQDQQYSGTIDGFNLIEGKDIMFVDGSAYSWSDFDLRPVYTVLKEPLEEQIDKRVEKQVERKIAKAKKVAGFKLVKKLTKKRK